MEIGKENFDIWFEGTDVQDYSNSSLPDNAEVVIIGAGITGITAAYLLSKNGIKAVVLEQNKMGEAVTCRTTGFLSAVLDLEPDKLIKQFGLDKAKEITKSHQEAIDEIEKIIISENINCDFKRCSNYFYANNEKEEIALKKLADNYQKIGLKADYKKDSTLGFTKFGYIEIYDQAKFNPIKYMIALAKIVIKNGGLIAENKKVVDIVEKDGSVDVVIENNQLIKTKRVFSATYFPFKNPIELKNKYNIYRSYVVEYKIPKNIFVEATFQDNQKPYHYFRIDKSNDSDKLMIGGNDHIDAIDIDHEIGAKVVREYTNNLLSIEHEEIRHWSGYMSEPVDNIACIGQLTNSDIFYAFGFSGNGMTYSYIASKIFTDLTMNINNNFSILYDLNNKTPWWKKLFL